MAAFEYRQAEELRSAFRRWNVRYLFIGKSGAILLGFPDTTQDVDVFPLRSAENGRASVAALREVGFALTDVQADEIERGKDFVQLKNGPFDLDLFFAPDGIDSFADAWTRIHYGIDGSSQRFVAGCGIRRVFDISDRPVRNALVTKAHSRSDYMRPRLERERPNCR